MRSPKGILICTDVSGAVSEADTFTCGHCNRVVAVKPRADPADMGGRCRVCDSLICKECAGLRACTPFERTVERAEARAQALRSYGL